MKMINLNPAVVKLINGKFYKIETPSYDKIKALGQDKLNCANGSPQPWQCGMYSWRNFLMSFSVDEWEVFILNLLSEHDKHRKRYSHLISEYLDYECFEIDLQCKLHYPDMMGNNYELKLTNLIEWNFVTTGFVETALSSHRRKLSEAVNNIITRYKKNNVIIESIIRNLGNFAIHENQIITFYFDVLIDLMESTSSEKVKKDVSIFLSNSMRGIEKPTPFVFLQSIIHHRNLFRGKDELLQDIILPLLFRGKFYWEVLVTLNFFTEKIIFKPCAMEQICLAFSQQKVSIVECEIFSKIPVSIMDQVEEGILFLGKGRYMWSAYSER